MSFLCQVIAVNNCYYEGKNEKIYISGVISATCYHDPENTSSGLISSTLDYKNACAADSKIDVRKWGDNQGNGAGTIYCATSKTITKTEQTKITQPHISKTGILPW